MLSINERRKSSPVEQTTNNQDSLRSSKHSKHNSQITSIPTLKHFESPTLNETPAMATVSQPPQPPPSQPPPPAGATAPRAGPQVVPSRQPLPLSASQEGQVRDIYYKRVRTKCAEEVRGTASPHPSQSPDTKSTPNSVLTTALQSSQHVPLIVHSRPRSCVDPNAKR